MSRVIFDTYIETQLAPNIGPGDVVILDNLSSHKSAKAESIIRAKGAWLLFLPPYSPDFNPIEMAFAKLKAYLRAPSQPEPSITSGKPSVTSAPSSHQKNAQTISKPQDMDSIKGAML